MPYDICDFLSLQLSEYLEMAICEHFQDDETYAKNGSLIDELSSALTEGQAHDSPINLLLDAMAMQESDNRDAIYWHGWSDCVKVLKKIELLIPFSASVD
ncbi:MAG: hypothetical protein RSD95_00645 [Clostridia bacterium]